MHPEFPMCPRIGLPRRRAVRPVVAVAVLCGLLCLGPTRALADDAALPARPVKANAKPAAKAAAKAPETKASDPLLTRDQLRECIARGDRVRDQNAEATQIQADLEREKADILKDGEALKADLASLDRSNAAAVEAYNAKAAARDKRIDAFEPRITAFNAKVETLKADHDSYARDCERRKFDEKDEKALQKKP